ncbi:cupin domain-containing protein [Acuticoccus yangtzensis]|uniref:cupin domain-containing protein n=1 Tax=Acuticoccus yangtzensis TaxID=1443441 RepID=UPI0009497D4D|nr:cupin domain-containing protein [Acuticoccus yangtzensis]
MQDQPAPAEIVRLSAPAAEGVPNNPALPAVVMRGAAEPSPAALRRLFAAHGWGGMWQWSIFRYHHYHPDAHEALACVAGNAEVMLGGPAGDTVAVEAGDVMVLPAGYGHCRITSSDDFSVCGAYPAGQEDYSTCRAGELPLDEAARRIAAVPLPRMDPVFGAGGPLAAAWGLAR